MLYIHMYMYFFHIVIIFMFDNLICLLLVRCERIVLGVSLYLSLYLWSKIDHFCLTFTLIFMCAWFEMDHVCNTIFCL